jgi:hypothetical protein
MTCVLMLVPLTLNVDCDKLIDRKFGIIQGFSSTEAYLLVA